LARAASTLRQCGPPNPLSLVMPGASARTLYVVGPLKDPPGIILRFEGMLTDHLAPRCPPPTSGPKFLP